MSETIQNEGGEVTGFDQNNNESETVIQDDQVQPESGGSPNKVFNDTYVPGDQMVEDIKFPEKFKNQDGSENNQELLKGYLALEKEWTKSNQEKSAAIIDADQFTDTLDKYDIPKDDQFDDALKLFQDLKMSQEQLDGLMPMWIDREDAPQGQTMAEYLELPSTNDQLNWLKEHHGENLEQVNDTVISLVKNQPPQVSKAILENAYLGDFIYRLYKGSGKPDTSHPVSAEQTLDSGRDRVQAINQEIARLNPKDPKIHALKKERQELWVKNAAFRSD